jgi:hypothetical protein
MTDLREAAQQALEALESAEVDPHSSDAVYKAITALRDALANYDAELAEIDSDGARCGVYRLPMWCDIHQHYKWCEHNGGVMGPTGWEKP